MMLHHGHARRMHVALHTLNRSTKAQTCVMTPPVCTRIASIRQFSEKKAAETAASTISSVSPSSATKPVVATRGFRKYTEQLKDKPASHVMAFAILHEITAVVPLPLVYFALTYTDTKIPFPEQALEEGNKFVGRIAKYYGWDIDPSTTDGARMMLNLASSYALVKALMPVRIALCLWMTPWTATRIISPVINIWKNVGKKLFRK